MWCNWGRYVAEQVFLEDEILINNGKLIGIDELEDKEKYNIKQIKYEEFPGIEKGFCYSNYWENTKNGIIQKWKKDKIPSDPSGRLKVDLNQCNEAFEEIFRTVDLLNEKNQELLKKLYERGKIIEPIYRASALIFGHGKVCSNFCEKKYTVKKLFEEIDLHSYFIDGGIEYNEEIDGYQSKEGEIVLFYPNIKRSFFEIDSLINFSTIGNKTYLKMSYVYLYTLLDDFMLKAIETIVRIDPRIMIKHIDKMPSKDIVESRGKSDLIEKMIKELSYKMGWKSFEEKTDFFKDSGIKIKRQDNNDLESEMIVIGEKRNVIVHNQGIVNKDFLKKISKTQFKDNFEIGNKLDLNINILKEDAMKMKKYIEDIFNAIGEKYELLPYD